MEAAVALLLGCIIGFAACMLAFIFGLLYISDDSE